MSQSSAYCRLVWEHLLGQPSAAGVIIHIRAPRIWHGNITTVRGVSALGGAKVA
jgi:hypothetical protein